MKNALIIEAEDNVVVVTDDVSVGEKVGYTLKGQNIELTAATDVPVYHKIFHCPVCSKFMASDEIEKHLLMCFSKTRLTYNSK